MPKNALGLIIALKYGMFSSSTLKQLDIALHAMEIADKISFVFMSFNLANCIS